jgi:hypothetical protein
MPASLRLRAGYSITSSSSGRLTLGSSIPGSRHRAGMSRLGRARAGQYGVCVRARYRSRDASENRTPSRQDLCPRDRPDEQGAPAASPDPAPQKTNIWYEGCGSSWATMARPMAIDGGDDAVDALDRLVLGRLEVAGRILGDGDVGGHPAGHGIAAMSELLGDDQLLELAGRRRHRAEALAVLDHRGPFVLEPQGDVGRVPGVLRDLLHPRDHSRRPADHGPRARRRLCRYRRDGTAARPRG